MTSGPAAASAADGLPLALIVLGPSGLTTAKRIKEQHDHAEIHGAAARLTQAEVDHSFDDLGHHLRARFQAGQPLLVLAAAAIPIRLLAPILDDKTQEPPVLAVAEDGSAVLPLLGGHRGANDLAREIGAILGVTAAITTAGDIRLGLALDQPPPGWTIGTPEAVKAVTAGLLADEGLDLNVEAGSAEDGAWLDSLRSLISPQAAHRILVTDRAISDVSAGALVYHPKTLVLGVGCERNTDPDELIGLVERSIADHHLAREAIAAIASISLKAAEPAVHALADHLGVPARFFDATILEQQRPRLANPSDVVFKETGCHGVAEGAALAAVGEPGELIVEKTKSKHATLAIGRAGTVLDPYEIGRPQGHLAIVSIGPGSSDWRSPEADHLLSGANHWIGYHGYLDLLTKPSHVEAYGFALGEEKDRARKALELAAGGERVALISSGDAGIYAMASLVFELLDGADDPGWARIDVTMTPGISALQAAAARVGAPLGHDFCAISLSDLLTPWPVIERRLRAAAEGDFVIALYNPASLKRRQGLARAIALLETARPAATPVIIAKNLGRSGEAIDVVQLRELDQDQVDMMSLVLIGSTRTRIAPRLHGHPFVYTPRGYLDDQNNEARSA